MEATKLAGKLGARRRPSSRGLIVLGALVLATAAGCAPEDGSDEVSEATDESLSTQGLWPSPGKPSVVTDNVGPIANAAANPFFNAFPRVGSITISENRTFPLTYRAPDVDSTYVIGLGDYATLAAATAGSGYKPFKLVVGGKERAVMRIIFLHYRTSDLGSYNEADIAVDVGPESLGHALDIPWVNDYSALVPYLAFPQARIFFAHSTVDAKDALDADYEILGLEKEMGQFAGELNAKSLKLSYLQDGRPAISMHMSIDGGIFGKLTSAFGLAAALGPTRLGLLNPKPKMPLDTLSTDARSPGNWVSVDYTAELNLTINPWSFGDVLTTSASSQVGAFVEQAHFKPLLKARDAHLSFAVDTIAPMPCPTYTTCKLASP